MKSIKNIRTDYIKNELNIEDLQKSPFDLFNLWMDDALKCIDEPNAFVLSTVNKNGLPSSRVLLLRGISSIGFSFYTNYNSQKAKDISINPNVSLNFFWPALERQIRINGQVRKLSDDESTNYFNSRPYDSQIGAWSSPQSQIINSRNILDERVDKFKNKYKNEVPRPPHWGGYIVEPESMEFWQGRASRLHDRFLFKIRDGKWDASRLAP
ncbi:MAG: pyridoxamine 5'-phosphate oxidase [Flavobacteriales bacterium]